VEFKRQLNLNRDKERPCVDRERANVPSGNDPGQGMMGTSRRAWCFGPQRRVHLPFGPFW
jgi:hypothetical protein